MNWARHFDDPVPLPGGGTLATLRAAGAHIAALPEATQRRPEWQAAAEALLVVVGNNGPTMLARIAMLRALSAGQATLSPRRVKRAKSYRIIS